MRRSHPTALLLAATACPAAFARLHTGDIVIAVQGGVLKTGNGVPSMGTFVPDRVFGVLMGAQGVPHFANNPGFDSEGGTFPVPSQIGFNILDRLYFWNGSAFVPTGGERMQINLGTSVVFTGDGPVAGFVLDVMSNGEWHRHLGYLLQQGTAPAIDPGVYMLPMSLHPTAPSIQDTPSFCLLFQDGGTTGDLTAAEAFVRTRVLPPAVAGDADGSGHVDFLDLNIVLSDFGTSGQWLAGDLNRDGHVDFLDLNIVLSAFGT